MFAHNLNVLEALAVREEDIVSQNFAPKQNIVLKCACKVNRIPVAFYNPFVPHLVRLKEEERGGQRNLGVIAK